MPDQVIDAAHVEPVFIESMNLPDSVDIPTMCRAAERVVGTAGIEGAFPDGGLWRIYPMSHAGRAMLLARGIDIGGRRIATDAANPFIMRGHNTDQPATRLTVGPLPFSMSEDAVIRGLEKEGFKVRGKMNWEMARLKDRTMTGWKTGRRVVNIELPATPPRNKFFQVGPLRVELYYREMKSQTTKCWNCQQFGHRSGECGNVPVCVGCKQPGHKKGDPLCSLGIPKCWNCQQPGHRSGVCVNEPVCADCKQTGHKRGDPRCGVNDDMARSMNDYTYKKYYRSDEDEIQGDQGSDDEPESGEEDKGREQGGQPTLDLQHDTSVNDRYVITRPEEQPLPSDADGLDVEANRTFTATTEAAPQETQKVHRRLYSHVVSGADSSSDEEITEQKEKVKPKRKIAKSKRVLKAKKGEQTDGLVQTDITSFHGLSLHNKRSVADTSIELHSKGMVAQKQKI